MPIFFHICQITVYAQTSFEAIYNRILSCFQLTFLLSLCISTSVMLQGRCCTCLKNKGAVFFSIVAKCLDFRFYLELSSWAWNWLFFAILYYGFYFRLISDSTLGDTPEDDATSQLEEENVIKVLFLFYLNKFSELYIPFSFAW